MLCSSSNWPRVEFPKERRDPCKKLMATLHPSAGGFHTNNFCRLHNTIKGASPAQSGATPAVHSTEETFFASMVRRFWWVLRVLVHVSGGVIDGEYLIIIMPEESAAVELFSHSLRSTLLGISPCHNFTRVLDASSWSNALISLRICSRRYSLFDVL